METDIPAGGYDPSVFAELAKLEASHFWFRARAELIRWALHRHHPHARSVLELGCGTGHVLSELALNDPRLHLVGSELFAEGLVHARSRLGPRAAFVQVDARRLPFRQAFDVVGAFDVIEHVVEDHEVLRQAYAALRPGGVLLLTVPQHPWLWSQADVKAHHVRRYTARSLHVAVSGAGFDILTSTSFVSLLLPVMVASRTLPRVSTNDPLAEMRLPAWLNRSLAAVMSLERRWVQTGVSLPFGGSRLLAARRH